MDNNKFKAHNNPNEVTPDEARKMKQDFTKHEKTVEKKPVTKPEDEIKNEDKTEK